ncbi:MAG: ABC transporter substrate-binding protein, partial [Acidimicrobiia bacterium]
MVATFAVAAAPAPGAEAASSSKPKRGGTATFLVSSEAVSLDNPKIAASGAAGAGNPAQLVYDALITMDPVTQKPIFRLAKSLESSPDAKVWTLKLKPGLMFSDKTPLDAAAVVSNWDRH